MLLNEFMEKDILYEPLKEARTSYESYLGKLENKELLNDENSEYYKYNM
jgi:hypothetical protein